MLHLQRWKRPEQIWGVTSNPVLFSLQRTRLEEAEDCAGKGGWDPFVPEDPCHPREATADQKKGNDLARSVLLVTAAIMRAEIGARRMSQFVCAAF